MVTPTLEQLKALPEAYLMEQNPTSSQMYRTSIAFIIVDTLVFSAFIYATYRNPKRSRIEQFFLMPLAYLSAIGMCLTGILTFRFGTGRHIAYYLLNDPETIVKLLQLQAGIEIFYMASVTLPKIVVLLLYRRIFMDRYARAAVWSLVAILVMFFFTGLILAFVHCRPYAFKWDKTIDGTCGDNITAYRTVSFPNIATDFFIMIIPIPLICKLHIGIWRKIGILITFLVGSLGFITSILRCVSVYSLNLLEDPIILGGETTKWSVIETSAYFICACLPRLRQPLAAVFEKSGISTFMPSKFNATWSLKLPSQWPTVPDSKLPKEISKIQASQLSNDTVGLTQLGDQIESQASHSGRLSSINSSRE